jgi:hypothetical protein
LIEDAHRVPIVAVVNPQSGPGDDANPDYADVIRRAAEAGVEVVGYINTGYATKRTAAEVKEDVDRWARFYPEIRGIFFDAQASSADHADFYAEIYAHAQKTLDPALIVSNPGTVCDEEYFARPTTDVAILFENSKGFEGFQLPRYAGGYQPVRFAALPYGVEGIEAMRQRVEAALLKGIGCVYVTDGVLPNPWARLPSYWDAEVEAVRRVNQHLAP